MKLQNQAILLVKRISLDQEFTLASESNVWKEWSSPDCGIIFLSNHVGPNSRVSFVLVKETNLQN